MPVLANHTRTSPSGLHARRLRRAVAPAVVKQTLARIPLRDYQKNAVRFFCAGIRDRDKVKVVELPTGTGKTRVGVAVAACLMRAGYTVLWACKSRRLLRQAADEFAHHFPECRSRVRWLGGTRRPQPLVRGGLVFTTLQTWHRRRHRLPGVISPAANLAVIWDEVHWAFGQSIGRFFREAYQGRVPVLGLTATPPHSTRAEMIYRRTPEEFFGTVLALPEFKQIATGVDWTPDVRHEEFTPSSLRRLAEDARRNTVVVETVIGLRAGGRAASILVFAANIPHAQDLTRRLSVSGVPARVIHSRMPAPEQDEAERLFRAGAVNVLVNVDQLTEGFDHPPVDAVLLTRPTRSRRRWIQMVGRGARMAPGKNTFLVVDFADNITRFGGGVVRAADVFPEYAGTSKPRPYRPPVCHTEPRDIPQFANYEIPEFGTITIALGQTFGVEIELTASEDSEDIPDADSGWRATAVKIIERLKKHVTATVYPMPLTGKGGPLDAWRVTYDASCGWEVVSPILVDAGGFDELSRACRAITELVEAGGGLRVNHRTGLHITLATRLDTDEKLRGFVRLVQRVEPGLFTLVAPSRLYRYDPDTRKYSRRVGNRYCLPLRGLGDPARLDLADFVVKDGNRYRTVNLTKSQGTVQLLEVRMHGGTHEFGKIALWLSLWMQLFNTARYRWTGPLSPGRVFPGRNSRIALSNTHKEDIVVLLEAEGIPLTPEFVRMLRQRRTQLRTAWAKAVPNRVSRWAAAGWYDW